MKWTPEEDKVLSDCASAGLTASEAAIVIERQCNTARSGAACSGRASKLGVSFVSASNITLRDYLAEGGRLVRDDIGGVVGVRWTRAHRGGENFNPKTCEFMLGVGLLAPEPNTNAVYRDAR